MSGPRSWFRVPRALAAVLALAGGAAADDPDLLVHPEEPVRRVSDRRPEPVPFRLQAALLRRLHVPAPAAAVALPAGDLDYFGLFNVTVFRRGDPGAPGTNNLVGMVGDHVTGVNRFRIGLAETPPRHGAFELGGELTALRWGRSPKFDDGPALNVTYRGTRWMDLNDPEAGFLDPVLWAKASAGDATAIATALQCSVSLPTGSRGHAMGAGTAGVALTWMGGLPLARGLFLDLNASVVFPRRPRGASGGHVRVATIYQGVLALSWAPLSQLTANLQFILASNPFPESGVTRLDEPIGEVLIAAEWTPAPGLAMGLIFTEDLTRTAPDFSASIYVRLRLGPR